MKLKRKKIPEYSYYNMFLIFPKIFNGKLHWLEWVTYKSHYSPIFNRYIGDKIVAIGRKADEYTITNDTKMIYKKMTDDEKLEYLFGENNTKLHSQSYRRVRKKI